MPIAYARNGDVNIAYETFGPPDGEPLLLIMGITFQMLWWPDGFCRELADRGFAVARYDNRDVGLSTHFSSQSRSTAKALFGRERGGPAYRIADMADDAIAVMDALGWSCAHLLGESLGATFAQLAAIRHPDRVRSLVCAMGGGTGGPIANLRNIKVSTLLRLAGKKYEDTREGSIQRLIDTYVIMCSRNHPVDEWIRATAEASWERDHEPDGTHRQIAASRTGADLRADLRRLRTPTLVIHGEDDPWIRLRASRTVAATIPGARLITYPAMGHEFPQHLWATIADDVWAAAQKAASAPVPDPDRPAAF